MKTVVLDDDPTGTQSATGVRVLLESDADLLEAALQDADSVYVQTNSRALHEEDAVALVRCIRLDAEQASERLVDYVTEKSGRRAVHVSLDTVRQNGLAGALKNAAAGSVVVPDAFDANDIRAIAAAIGEATEACVHLVVRSAAPLAAELAGVASDGLLAGPLVTQTPATLLVCGSHTGGATAQLAPIVDRWGSAAVVEKVRAADHGTLDHGERVMTALTTAVRAVLPHVSVVVAKGGITSAEVAHTGVGATSALVLGQILPGVSVWRMDAHDGRDILYVVVPGNVGEPDTLTQILGALQVA